MGVMVRDYVKMKRAYAIMVGKKSKTVQVIKRDDLNVIIKA